MRAAIDRRATQPPSAKARPQFKVRRADQRDRRERADATTFVPSWLHLDGNQNR
jgi:hypothetical protein